MIEKALKFLLTFRDTEITEHNGFKYANRQLSQLPEDAPSVFNTKTLASLVGLSGDTALETSNIIHKAIAKIIGKEVYL